MNLQTATSKTTSKEVNARAALVALAEANPKDQKDPVAMFRHFKAELATDPDLQDAVDRFFFSHWWPNVRQELERKELTRLKKGTPKQRAKAAKIEEEQKEKREQRQAAKQASVAAAVNTIKSKMVEAKKADLLSMTMRDGRPLGEWTAKDAALESGFLGRLALAASTRGVPDKPFKNIFTAKQVEKIHQAK